MPIIWVLNGPNLNLLGSREPELYGHTMLADLEKALMTQGAALGFEVRCYQSNHEGELVSRIQAARGQAVGLVLNPGAYGHTSIALRDALSAVGLPTIEVHLTNVARREPFRHVSMIAAACAGSIVGLGALGYRLALDALAALLAERGAPPEAIP